MLGKGDQREQKCRKTIGEEEEIRICSGGAMGGFGETTTVESTQAHLLIAHLPIGLVPKA